MLILYFLFLLFFLLILFSINFLLFSLSLSLSLSLIFFLTILDNLAMIIIDQNSIHFSSLHLFGLVRSTSIQFGLLRFTLVQLGPFSPFIPIQSIWFTSVYFNLLRSIWHVRSNSIHSVHLVYFSPLHPLWSIQSIWPISNHFCPIWCTYLRMRKYKFGLRLLSIICVVPIVIIW